MWRGQSQSLWSQFIRLFILEYLVHSSFVNISNTFVVFYLYFILSGGWNWTVLQPVWANTKTAGIPECVQSKVKSQDDGRTRTKIRWWLCNLLQDKQVSPVGLGNCHIKLFAIVLPWFLIRTIASPIWVPIHSLTRSVPHSSPDGICSIIQSLFFSFSFAIFFYSWKGTLCSLLHIQP